MRGITVKKVIQNHKTTKPAQKRKRDGATLLKYILINPIMKFYYNLALSK